MQKHLLITITVLLLSSCAKHVEKNQYYKFSKQVTPNGKYVIYDYARYGDMAFSSDFGGTELFKIDDVFSEGKGEKINGVISEWTSNDTLTIFNFKQLRNNLYSNIEYGKLGDFVIKTIFYKTNGGGRLISDFDDVRTSNDSIFTNLLTDKGEKEIVKFPLGAVTIRTKGDSISDIRVDNRINNFVDENEAKNFSKGLPKIVTLWYDLTPSKKISPKGLNKTKIFWEEK